MSVSPLGDYNFSTTAPLADTPFVPPEERLAQIWERSLPARAKRSVNSENPKYVMQEIATPWPHFYTQAAQEMRAHQITQSQNQIKPLVTISRKDPNSTSPFIPDSPLEFRDTTIDALLNTKLNDGDTVSKLNPLERITVANQILDHQGENAENLLYYEAFDSVTDLDHEDLTQSQNQLDRIMTHLDRTKTAFSLEISGLTDLWVQARTETILHTAEIGYFDTFTPCKKTFKIKGLTAVFRGSALRNQGSPLPDLKAHLKFHHWPRICQMQSGRSFLVLPNGELADYDAIRENDLSHPDFWDHLAFELKVLPILPREVIQKQADEGKSYSFLRWEPEISEQVIDRKSIKDYVEKGVHAHSKKHPDLKKIADLVFPQTETELRKSRRGIALAFLLHKAGFPWEDKSKAAILHGVEVMKAQPESEEQWDWRIGIEAALSHLHGINQVRFFSLPTAEKVLDTAKRTKAEGYRKLIEEVQRKARALYPNRVQETPQMPVEQSSDLHPSPPVLLTRSTGVFQESTEPTPPSPSPTTFIDPIAEANLAVNVSMATMSQLLDLGETASENPQEFLAVRNSIVHPIQDPLQYERAKTLVNLEISNWATQQPNQQNLTRQEIVDNYFIWQKSISTTFGNWTLPDFTREALLEPSSDSFGENVAATTETLTMPSFRAENIVSVLNEEEINLRLDVQRIAGGLLETQTTQPSFNYPSERSLFTVCVEAVRFLAGAIGDKLTPTQALTVRNQILNQSSALYGPSSAPALLHLESRIWAIESRNEDLSPLQRSHAYLDRLNNNDPFQPITNTSDIIDSPADFDQELTLFEKGSLHSARARAFQELLGEEVKGLSQMDMVNEASDLLNSEKEGYDETLAQEFTNLEAKIWAEEALSDDLIEGEIFDAYLSKTSYLANPPKIPDFQTRPKIAEEYVREHYPEGRYYDTCNAHPLRPTYCTTNDRVHDALKWGGVNGVDSRYNSQLNILLEEGPNSIIAILAKENFKKTGLPYSELIRSARRVWVIKDFAPLYRKSFVGRYLNKSRIDFLIHKTGANIYSGDPTLFETAKGRFGIVLPNGEISFFDQSPLTSSGEVSHSAIATALGLGSLDGLPYTRVYPNGVEVKWPFQGWSMSVDESTLT